MAEVLVKLITLNTLGKVEAVCVCTCLFVCVCVCVCAGLFAFNQKTVWAFVCSWPQENDSLFICGFYAAGVVSPAK